MSYQTVQSTVSPGCDTVSSMGTDANHTTHKPTTVSTNLKLQLVEPVAMILFVCGVIKFSGTNIEISIHYMLIIPHMEPGGYENGTAEH